jgi:serine phosphatase RsbU (regulator of sigma subunit)
VGRSLRRLDCGRVNVELMAVDGLRAVLRVTAALHETGSSPDRFHRAAVEAVVTTVGADRAALLLTDADGVMRFKAWHGLSEGYRRAVEGHTPWAPDDADAEPILVPDVFADPAMAEFWSVFEAEGIGALAFVPLLHQRRVVGKFMLYYDASHAFSESELAVAEVLAGQVAVSVHRRRHDEAERAAVSRLAGLQRVTAELSRAVTLVDAAAAVLGPARAELGASTAAVCLRSGDDLEIVEALGYPDEVMTHWRWFPLAADLPASEAVRTGRAVFLRSPAERDGRYPVFASSPVTADAAFAVVPLSDTEPLGCLVFGFAESREFPPEDEAFLGALAGQCDAAFSRARLYEDRERSRAMAAFLAEASAALGRSFDPAELVTATAELTAGRLADRCTISLVEERLEIGAGQATPAGDGAVLTVPLTIRGRPAGALTLANDGARPLGPGTADVARELAGRIAVAVDHARSYRREVRLSRTLQASLLPPSLPEIPGIELAACYAAGGAGVEVGGDLYDVVPLDGRRFVLVVGDVCGRGIDAATTASLVRHTIRSAALTDPSPAAILSHLNDVLLRNNEPGRFEPRFCTAVVALVSAAEGPAPTVTLAVGGHPLPVLRRADGTVATVGSPGSLIGVVADAAVSETGIALAPGDALVSYTDGVTERRRGDVFYGVDGLLATLRAASGDAASLAGAVEQAVLAFAADPPSDDLAILVLRTGPPAG